MTLFRVLRHYILRFQIVECRVSPEKSVSHPPRLPPISLHRIAQKTACICMQRMARTQSVSMFDFLIWAHNNFALNRWRRTTASSERKVNELFSVQLHEMARKFDRVRLCCAGEKKLRKGSREIYYKYFDVEMSQCTLQAPVDVDVRFADFQISLVPVAPKILHFTGWCSEWRRKESSAQQRVETIEPILKAIAMSSTFWWVRWATERAKKTQHRAKGKIAEKERSRFTLSGRRNSLHLAVFLLFVCCAFFHYNLLVSPSLHLLRRSYDEIFTTILRCCPHCRGVRFLFILSLLPIPYACASAENHHNNIIADDFFVYDEKGVFPLPLLRLFSRQLQPAFELIENGARSRLHVVSVVYVVGWVE